MATFLLTFIFFLNRELFRKIKCWKDENPKKFWLIVAAIVLGVSLSVALPIIGFGTGGIIAGKEGPPFKLLLLFLSHLCINETIG